MLQIALNKNNVSRYVLNVEFLSPGIYSMQAKANKFIETRKLIVQ